LIVEYVFFVVFYFVRVGNFFPWSTLVLQKLISLKPLAFGGGHFAKTVFGFDVPGKIVRGRVFGVVGFHSLSTHGPDWVTV